MNKFNTQSLAMRFFRAIGIERVAWSLRRLHCPVDDNALVLEVGSGGNPYEVPPINSLPRVTYN